MALTVTSANTNNLRGGARNVMRSPSGIPYVVLVDATDGGIEVWKGDGVSPTAFTEQNAAANPQTSGYGCVSAAMDSSGVIHIAYMYYNTKVSQLRYVTYNTATDTFSGDVAVKADIGNDPISLSNLFTAIAVDGNDVPHVAYSEYPNKGGLPSLFYNNRIGGAWNSAGLEVEGATNGYPCAGYDLAIDLDNRPVVSYVRMVLRDFEYNAVAAIGNTNDPTGWTLKDLVFQSATGRTSIVVDPAGNHYVLCGELSYPRIYRHNRADSWTTWTSIYSGSSIEGRSLSWSGTNLYFFYESSAGNVCYQTFDGSTWSAETVLETGSFTFVKSKWGFWADCDSSGNMVTKIPFARRAANEIDYAFVDNTASPDIWWGNLPLTVAGWASKPLKVYLGGSWTTKPLKYHNGSAWVEKPLKAFS